VQQNWKVDPAAIKARDRYIMQRFAKGDTKANIARKLGLTQDMAGNLTKRELFAAMAMQGLRANANDRCPRLSGTIAELAVADADALIAELSK